MSANLSKLFQRKLLQTAAVFAALGDETRLALLNRLSSEGPLSITRLTEGAGVTRQAITRHLDVLQSAGLTVSHREGRERIWSMDPRRLKNARRSLEEISARWDAALERLRQFVEES
jgi:DNA-binding transcriptional ArsR family regulator